MSKLTVLAGGVGAARFLQGLIRVVKQEEITVISNTADDLKLYGLHISPDIDIVIYTLAGVVDGAKGWGIAQDTFFCLDAIGKLGEETWFRLGDRDLATHIFRTDLLRKGMSISRVTATIAHSFGLRLTILPMSEERVETFINTEAGPLDIQQYLVKRGAKDKVQSITYRGIEKAKATRGVIESILEAEGVILAPSNPFISLGPILAVRGVRDAIRSTRARVVAISPIVGGAAIKGPAATMMRHLGMEPSSYQVATLYKDFLDAFILDNRDEGLRPKVESLGITALATNTIMSGTEEKVTLARSALSVLKDSTT